MTIKSKPNQPYWFVRKTFGWGWTPITWQGWLVTILYMVVLGGFSFVAEKWLPLPLAPIVFVGLVVLLTVALLTIAYKKGEPPRWQWGEKK